MAAEGAGAVAQVTSGMGEIVLKPAAKKALDVTVEIAGYLVSLKIENEWLARVFTIGVLGWGFFYIHRRYPAQPAQKKAAEHASENPEIRPLVDATRNALERSEAGVIDPEVAQIEEGSIQVTLLCHTEQSLLLFLDDFETGKVKERLEKEFRKLGCEEELKVTISNLDEVYKRLNQTRVKDAESKVGDFENRAEKVESTGTDSVKGLLTSPGYNNADTKLPSKNPKFIGREAVVQEIVQKLTQYPLLSRIIVIVDLPGMGKTQVAIHVSHLLKEKHKKPVIFIEQKQNLTEICSEILRQINPLARRNSDVHDMVMIAKRRISEVNESKVIVLDNTEGIQQQQGRKFEEFLRYVERYAPQVQLIITTQEDVGFRHPGIRKVRLNRLDPESSAKLIQDSVPNCEEEYIKELSKLCGGIPLVLINCAGLLEEHFSPVELVEHLKENPIPLLKTSAEDIYNALKQFLPSFSENIKANLVCLSVFPSTFSSEDTTALFRDVLKPEAFKTRTTIIKRSLLRITDNAKLVLHPLVREFLKAERRLLNMDDIGKKVQHKFNQHYLEFLESSSKQYINKGWFQNAISNFRREKANILEMFRNFLWEGGDNKETESCIDVANSTVVLHFLLKVLSPPAECVRLYERCYHIAVASNDTRRIADSLTALGSCGFYGKTHGSELPFDNIEKFQRACEIRGTLPTELQRCETHAHTISKLGLCHARQGELQKGLELIQEAIDLRKELGLRLYVAASYCDLGNAYRACGDHEQAIHIWEKETLPVYKDELGDHPWTASILRYIASSYRCLAKSESADSGIADQAEMYSREALELRIKLLREHQDTARSHVDLSDILIIKKDFKSAMEQLEKAIEIQKDVLGEEHETTKKTLKQLREVQSVVE